MVLTSDIDLSITLLDSMRHSSIRAADAGIGASELSDSGLLVVKIVCCAPFGAETSAAEAAILFVLRVARLEAAPFQGKIKNQSFLQPVKPCPGPEMLCFKRMTYLNTKSNASVLR
jgi:hypothetical protein